MSESPSAMKTYQLTLVTGTTSRHALNVILLLSGAALTTLIGAIRRRLRRRSLSAGVERQAFYHRFLDPLSPVIIDSRAAIDRLLYSHYSSPSNMIDMDMDPATKAGLAQVTSLTSRVGVLAERYCPALKDFTGERGETTALDVGCSVGGVTFELARSFQVVHGCDASKECIRVARTMKSRGWMRCNLIDEVDLHTEKTVTVDEDIDRTRVQFGFMPFDKIRGDCFSSTFDAVVCLNTLSRMENPAEFLRNLPDIVAPDGIVVLSSLFDWTEDATPRHNWLGGFISKDGKAVKSLDAIKGIMQMQFTLLWEENHPFFVRDTGRRAVINMASITVWQKA